MMEFKNLALLVIISFLVSTSFIAITQSGKAAVEDDRIEIAIDGPEKYFVNETVSYEVEIKGYFRANDKVIRAEQADNWTLKTESTLESTIDPLESDSTTSNIFTVNVTVREEGDGELEFRAYCGKDDEVAFNEENFKINVEKPERTMVTVKNPSDVHIEKMKVGLYINGELKAIQTLEDFEPDEERRVTFEWSKRELEAGEHTLEVWANYGTSEDGGFDKEQLLTSRTFKIEEETSSTLYAGIIVAAIAGSVLLFIWYRNRRRRQRRPW